MNSINQKEELLKAHGILQFYQQQNLQKLQNITVLIIFLLVVIIAIYLISMLLIILRKFKTIFTQKHTSTRIYYSIVSLYIITKLVLCSILIFKMLSEIPNQWANLNGEDIEMVLKNSIVLADMTIIELFLVALYYYLKICFIAMGKDQSIKIRNLLLYIIKAMIIITFLALFISLLVFDFQHFNYEILNAIGTGFNGSVIILFLVSFFYLNFKMTGLLVQNRLNSVIKKLYKVLSVILISRIIMFSIQLTIAFKIHDGSFQSFVQFFQEINGEVVAFGLSFIIAILIILLTQGLPIMYSLKNSIIESFSQSQKYKQRLPSYQKQSIITSNSSILKEQLLKSNQYFQFQGENQSQQNRQNQQECQSLSKFKNLHDIDDSENSIWTLKRGEYGKDQYMLKIAKHQISSYIIQDIQTEMNKWKQLKLNCLSAVSFFKQKQFICIMEKYFPYNLDNLIDTNKSNNQKQTIYIALQIAKGIEELHRNDISHGGLKPSYILFDKNRRLYFTGLGLSSFKKYLSLITGYTNKSMYTAVQLLGDKNNVIIKPKKQNDIYSFGMILYEMITKNKLYRDQTIKECKQRFFQQKNRPKIPQNLNGKVKSLIRSCWQDQSSKRPSITQAIISLKKVIDQY